jgi:hypothetical protein
MMREAGTGLAHAFKGPAEKGWFGLCFIKPRLCRSLLLRLENPCCPAAAEFPDSVPRHIYKYAYVTKSLQLLVSIRFSAPRYGFYCTIWVKKSRLPVDEYDGDQSEDQGSYFQTLDFFSKKQVCSHGTRDDHCNAYDWKDLRTLPPFNTKRPN